MRGYLLVGAVQELARRQPLEFPQGIYGLSVGSVIATALAYRVSPERIQTLFSEITLDDVLPSLRLPHLLEAPKAKGLQSMETFEATLLRSFDALGINLRTAMLGDAPQPLAIIASNLTRCTPTVFRGQVRTLDAIKASCALPLVFHPQVIYDSVYVDGGLFVPSIVEVLPPEVQDRGLILNLARPKRGLSPDELADLSPWQQVERLHQSSTEYRLKTTLGPQSVWLKNDTVHTMDRLKPEQRKALIDSGAAQLTAFWAKHLDKP